MGKPANKNNEFIGSEKLMFFIDNSQGPTVTLVNITHPRICPNFPRSSDQDLNTIKSAGISIIKLVMVPST